MVNVESGDSPNNSQAYDNRPYWQGKSVLFSRNSPPRRGNFTLDDPPRGDNSISYHPDFQQCQQAHGQYESELYDPRAKGQRANEYSRGPFRPYYDSEPVAHYPQAEYRARYGLSQPTHGAFVHEVASMYRSNYSSQRESQQCFNQIYVKIHDFILSKITIKDALGNPIDSENLILIPGVVKTTIVNTFWMINVINNMHTQSVWSMQNLPLLLTRLLCLLKIELLPP